MDTLKIVFDIHQKLKERLENDFTQIATADLTELLNIANLAQKIADLSITIEKLREQNYPDNRAENALKGYKNEAAQAEREFWYEKKRAAQSEKDYWINKKLTNEKL